AGSAGRFITEADCTAGRLGVGIPASAIGERVSRVTLSAPRWTAAGANAPGYCSVDGSMAPVDRRPTAKPINFRVVLPVTWNHRAAQLGGAGINGTIPNLTGGADSPLARGFVTYGSDSGHQTGGGGGPGGARGGQASPGLQ